MKLSNYFNSLSIIILVVLTTSSTLPSFGQSNRSPVYFGYEVAYSIRSYQINSNIEKIDGLQVIQEGVTLGAKWGTARTSVRGFAGLYYSSDAVPHSIDLIEAGFTGSYYLLRNKRAKFHTFEPYALFTMRYQQARFFGNYLNAEGESNMSTSEEKKLGCVGWISPAIGAGVEFQLENENRQFIHFFLEGKAGMPLKHFSSCDNFSKTNVETPYSFTLGVSFGKFKYEGFKM